MPKNSTRHIASHKHKHKHKHKQQQAQAQAATSTSTSTSTCTSSTSTSTSTHTFKQPSPSHTPPGSTKSKCTACTKQQKSPNHSAPNNHRRNRRRKQHPTHSARHKQTFMHTHARTCASRKNVRWHKMTSSSLLRILSLGFSYSRFNWCSSSSPPIFFWCKGGIGCNMDIVLHNRSLEKRLPFI